MNTTICENCNAINMQGCEICHNCKRVLYKRLPSSNTTSLQKNNSVSTKTEQ